MENKEEIKIEPPKKNKPGLDINSILPLLSMQNPQMASALSLMSGDNNNEAMIKALSGLMNKKQDQTTTRDSKFKGDKIDLAAYKRIE